MNEKSVESLKSDHFSVTRKRVIRTYVSKGDMPEDIWNKYANRCSYDVLYIKPRTTPRTNLD
jgi:hypothetical protein